MSETAKTARKAMRDKIDRLVKPTTGPVDASDYGAPPTFSAEEPTGKAPVTRQHKFRRGGKVEGEATKARADKSPRKGPKREHRDSGGIVDALSPAAAIIDGKGKDALKIVSPAANLKTGGRTKKADGGSFVPTERFGFTSGPSRMSKSMGLKKGGSVSDGELEGTRPTGGRLARKSGGRAGKTNINIIISPKGGEPDQPSAPPAPMMKPPGMALGVPPAPPPGMPAGPPPGLMPPGMGPPPGPPPMMRRRGGRAQMKAGAGSGEGRLEKLGLR